MFSRSEPYRYIQILFFRKRIGLYIRILIVSYPEIAKFRVVIQGRFHRRPDTKHLIYKHLIVFIFDTADSRFVQHTKVFIGIIAHTSPKGEKSYHYK